MTSKQVAVIQMVSGLDVSANLAQAAALLRQAQQQGAQLAVLPENFATFGQTNPAEYARAEADGHGPLLTWLRHTARALGIWIVAGTLPLFPTGQRSGKPCAASLLVDAQGECVARYDKLHLFDAQVADARGQYRESDEFAAGQAVVVAETPVGRLGLSVCYDLRFPALYEALRVAGAELISAPSAFTAKTGAAHWEVLIRARAIETQCAVLAANQGGTHPGPRETWGHSLIVDAWGTPLAHAECGEAVLVADFDFSAQAAIRQAMPVVAHRRFTHGTLPSFAMESA